ncbi:unnamed protein product [Dovyalis caffra]|uniref:Uncharacterized protein n=1 Tax=Dovyalis caffra TaxID=77055 RepID=A0AAV1R0I6_9ROSI|nr:unnamed protein product [Dovyalis caffra]
MAKQFSKFCPLCIMKNTVSCQSTAREEIERAANKTFFEAKLGNKILSPAQAKKYPAASKLVPEIPSFSSSAIIRHYHKAPVATKTRAPMSAQAPLYTPLCGPAWQFKLHRDAFDYYTAPLNTILRLRIDASHYLDMTRQLQPQPQLDRFFIDGIMVHKSISSQTRKLALLHFGMGNLLDKGCGRPDPTQMIALLICSTPAVHTDDREQNRPFNSGFHHFQGERGLETVQKQEPAGRYYQSSLRNLQPRLFLFS